MALAASLNFGLLSWAQAHTTTAASASLVDVTRAVASAVNGDTVVVPAGTASWASMLTVTKGITLQGATSITGPTSGPAVTDSTIILDNVPRDSGHKQGALFFINGADSFRLTGFTFRRGGLTTLNQHPILTGGVNHLLRIDHCHFDTLIVNHTMDFFGWTYGVVDHNVLHINTRGGGSAGGNTASIYADAWNGKPSGWGSWADDTNFGSANFLFFEDNTIYNPIGNPVNGGSLDADRGGRYVARHNYFYNCDINYHGTDSGAGGVYLRGARAIEIYNNTFVNQGSTSLPGGQARGGVLLWHHNTFTGPFNGGMTLRPYRMFQGGPYPPTNNNLWGAANGTNPWDYNATEADGTHVDGHTPYTFATGNVIANVSSTNNTTSLTSDASPTWTDHQWKGYSITNTSAASPYFNGANYISDNIGNVLTLTSFAAQPPYPKFDNGNTFAIHKVLIVFDQPGRGKSDVLVGNLPGTGNPFWQHQLLEPSYSWNNTIQPLVGGTPAPLYFDNDDSQNILRANVDYYNNTPMPGYAPYTYPHPLVSGLLAPKNLRVLP